MYVCMLVCIYVCKCNLHTDDRPFVRVSVGAYVRVFLCLFHTQELPLGNKNLEVKTKNSELRSRKLEVGTRNLEVGIW